MPSPIASQGTVPLSMGELHRPESGFISTITSLRIVNEGSSPWTLVVYRIIGNSVVELFSATLAAGDKYIDTTQYVLSDNMALSASTNISEKVKYAIDGFTEKVSS